MRNVRLNFRQQERSHLMENMIYNDLIRRGYSVDVGIVELTRIIEGRRRSSQYKIDFVVNVGNDKLYIQSALHVDTPEKKAQETFSLRNTGDFFRKIVVLDGNSKPWTDEDGVMYVGVIPRRSDKTGDGVSCPAGKNGRYGLSVSTTVQEAVGRLAGPSCRFSNANTGCFCRFSTIRGFWAEYKRMATREKRDGERLSAVTA